MADNRRWNVSYARGFTAVALAAVAFFVICAGAGLANWTVVAVGVAGLALAVTLVVVAIVRGSAHNFVRGMAHVLTATEPIGSGSGRCEMQIIVRAPGMESVKVNIVELRVPVDKWPSPRDDLPIRVAIDDPRQVRVLWREARSHSQMAADEERFNTHLRRLVDADLGPGSPAAPADRRYAMDEELNAHMRRIVEADGDPPPSAPTAPRPRPSPRRRRGSRETTASATAAAAAAAGAAAAGMAGSVAVADPRPESEPPAAPPPSEPAASAASAPPTLTMPEQRTPTDAPAAPADQAGQQTPTDTLASPDLAGQHTTTDAPAVPPANQAGPADQAQTAAPAEPAASAAASLDAPFTASIILTVPGAAPTAVSSAPTAGKPAPAAADPDDEDDVYATDPATVLPPIVDEDIPVYDIVPIEGASAVLGVRPTIETVAAEPDDILDESEELIVDADLSEPSPADAAAVADLLAAYPSARPGPAGGIHGIGVRLIVTDLARSIAFYRDVLGFFVIDSGPSSAVLASGETRIMLRRVSDMAPVDRRLMHIHLEVGDVEAVYADLLSKGVTFLHRPRPIARGEQMDLWAAAFRDPDGHGIALIRWQPRGGGALAST